jgi:hypothetical protein
MKNKIPLDEYQYNLFHRACHIFIIANASLHNGMRRAADNRTPPFFRNYGSSILTMMVSVMAQ